MADLKLSRTLFVAVGLAHIDLCTGDGAGTVRCVAERGEDGRLSPASLAALKRCASDLIASRSPGWCTGIVCTLPGRGVSIRSILVPSTVPAATLHSVVRLQIESQFPISPDLLAWGWQEPPKLATGTTATPSPQREVTVFALRKEILESYAEALSATSLPVWFTLGAVGSRASRSGGQPTDCNRLLCLGPNHSELWTFHADCPTSLKQVPLGTESRALLSQEAEAAELASRLRRALDSAPDSADGPLLVEVDPTHASDASSLLRGLEPRLRFEILQGRQDGAIPPSILGLIRLLETGRLDSVPLFITRATVPPSPSSSRERLRYAAVAGLIVLALIGVRYGEAAVGEARGTKKLQQVRKYKENFPTIDKELSFLQHLQSHQNAFLDVLYVVGKASPPGTKMDSFSMSRRGDLSLRLTFRPPDQALSFRSNLIASGFFTNLVVEEQSPSQDRQQMVLRITAQTRDRESRSPLVIPPSTPPASNLVAQSGSKSGPGASQPSPSAATSNRPTATPSATNAQTNQPAAGKSLSNSNARTR